MPHQSSNQCALSSVWAKPHCAQMHCIIGLAKDAVGCDFMKHMHWFFSSHGAPNKPMIVLASIMHLFAPWISRVGRAVCTLCCTQTQNSWTQEQISMQIREPVGSIFVDHQSMYTVYDCTKWNIWIRIPSSRLTVIYLGIYVAVYTSCCIWVHNSVSSTVLGFIFAEQFTYARNRLYLHRG